MPDQVLASLNSAFPMEQQGGMYFTMWYGVYDTMSRSLTFSSAGHPPALLFEGNSSAYSGLRRLQTGNLFIGGLSDTQFQTERIILGETNRLYVYSDGVFEISTGNGSMWSFSQFEDFMARFSESDESIIEQVFTHVRDLNGTNAFEDDFSILEVSIKVESA
jgi:sigma-B regulation protein RsbU (phosphoserine phosphatase)